MVSSENIKWLVKIFGGKLFYEIHVFVFENFNYTYSRGAIVGRA